MMKKRQVPFTEQYVNGLAREIFTKYPNYFFSYFLNSSEQYNNYSSYYSYLDAVFPQLDDADIVKASKKSTEQALYKALKKNKEINKHFDIGLQNLTKKIIIHTLAHREIIENERVVAIHHDKTQKQQLQEKIKQDNIKREKDRKKRKLDLESKLLQSIFLNSLSKDQKNILSKMDKDKNKWIKKLQPNQVQNQQ